MSKKLIVRLEKTVRRQQAEIDMLKNAVVRLTHERDTARVELKEERVRHHETRRMLQELMHATAHLDERLKALLRKQFGAASERMNEKASGQQQYIADVLDILDEDMRTAIEDARQQQAKAEHILQSEQGDNENEAAAQQQADTEQTERKARTRPPRSGGRKPLPADLERQTADYYPPEDHPALHGASNVDIIDYVTQERLDVNKVKVFVAATRCPVALVTYGNGAHQRTVRTTLSPPSILGRGQATDAFLTESVCEKVSEHLPNYRQSTRLAESKLDLPRSKLSRWHMTYAAFIEVVASAIFNELQTECVLGVDDTVHRLLCNEGACHNGRLWLIAGAAGFYYQFHTTREGKWIDQLLHEYVGDIMGDAYGGHNALLRREHIRALFCWAHVRRKFYDSRPGEHRTLILALIGKLYAIENHIADLPPDERTKKRQEKSVPILNAIKEKLDAWHDDPRMLPKSGVGKGVRYALKLWDGLTAYVTNPAAPIDNNHTERGMRPNALHRKNSLFSASIQGAESYATLLTVIQSAKLHDLNVREYLNDIIEDLHHQRRTPAELTPAQYAKRLQGRVKICS